MDSKEFGAKFESLVTSESEKFFASVNRIWPWLGGLFIVLFIAQLSGCDMNNSDQNARQRSGLKIHRDALTGCEYLSTAQGGLHIRLTADGILQMGCREGSVK